MSNPFSPLRPRSAVLHRPSTKQLPPVSRLGNRRPGSSLGTRKRNIPILAQRRGATGKYTNSRFGFQQALRKKRSENPPSRATSTASLSAPAPQPTPSSSATLNKTTPRDGHSDEEEDRINQSKTTSVSDMADDSGAGAPQVSASPAAHGAGGGGGGGEEVGGKQTLSRSTPHGESGLNGSNSAPVLDEPTDVGGFRGPSRLNTPVGRHANSAAALQHRLNQRRPVSTGTSAWGYIHPHQREDNGPRGRSRAALARGHKQHAVGAGLLRGPKFGFHQQDNRPMTAPAPAQVSPNTHIDQLKQENHRLKNQVERMRIDSFRKIRGGKRFVSGGGFRAGRAIGEDSSAASKIGKNQGDSLKHLKNMIRQLATEKQQLQQELADVKLQLSRCMQSQRALFQQAEAAEVEKGRLGEIVSQKQRRIEEQTSELRSLRKQVSDLVAADETSQQTIAELRARLEEQSMAVTQVDDTVREDVVPRAELEALQVQNRRLQTSLDGAQMERDKAVNERDALRKQLQQSAIDKSASSSEVAELRRQLKEAHGERDAARQEASQAKDEAAVLVKDLDTLAGEMEAEKKRRGAAEAQAKALSAQLLDLQDQIRRLKSQHEEASSASQKERDDELARLRKRIRELEALVGELRDSLKAEQDARAQLEAALKEAQSQHSGSMGELEARLQQLAADCASKDSELKRLRGLKHGHTAEIEKLRGQISDLEKDLKAMQTQASQAARDAKAAKAELQDAKLDASRNASILKATKKALGEAKSSLSDATEGRRVAEANLAEMVEKMKQLKAASKEAMRKAKQEAIETSLQSMVRLCVVAPTVNVHFNQQQQQCKGPMPKDRIKGIIEHDVIPKFTELFIQGEEGTAKDGSRLETWLEEMLSEMQGSIQTHLQDVFSAPSAGLNGPTPQRSSGGRPGRPMTSQAASRRRPMSGQGRRPASRGY